jgi:hypothetical protein
MNKTASQIGAAVFTKLGLLSRRLDSGAATNRAALRQKYIDAGWDDPSADLYSRNAAQKLFKEHGAMGMRQAVSGFQAPSGAGMGPIVGVLRTNKTASQIAGEVLYKLGFGADAAFAELDASTSSGTSRPSRSNSPAAAAKAMTVAQPKPAAPPPPAVAAAPTPAASPTAGKPSSNFAPAARNLPAPKPVAAPAASSPPALNPPPAARQQRRRPLMSMQQIRNARARQQYGG